MLNDLLFSIAERLSRYERYNISPWYLNHPYFYQKEKNHLFNWFASNFVYEITINYKDVKRVYLEEMLAIHKKDSNTVTNIDVFYVGIREIEDVLDKLYYHRFDSQVNLKFASLINYEYFKYYRTSCGNNFNILLTEQECLKMSHELKIFLLPKHFFGALCFFSHMGLLKLYKNNYSISSDLKFEIDAGISLL